MPYVPHSTLVGANLHYNMGDSRSAMAWTLAAGTADALLIENSNGNDLLSIETSTTAGLTVLAFGNATDRPQHEFYGTSFSLVVPDDQTVFQITANGETPVRVETSSTTPHTLRLNNAWVRMAELSSAPTNVAGSGFLYTRDDAGTTRLRFMRDDGSTVDLDNQGGGTPGGSDTQVQYNNAGAFGGMANVAHDGAGNLLLLEDLPAEPAAGALVPHARSEAIPLLASRIDGEAGMLVGLPWASADVFMWRPLSSGPMFEIGTASSTTGSPSTPNPSSGSMASRARRNRHVSSAAINQGTGRYNSVAIIALETGFWIKFRLALAALNSDSYAFVGLTSSVSSITGASPPSGFLDCIGFGKNGGDTNWQVISNDGSGSAVTHASLGTDFPTTTTTAIVDLVLYAPAGGSTVSYWANRVDTAVTPVSGTITTDLPASTVFMTPRVYANTGPTTGTAVNLDLMFMTGWKLV